MKLNNLNGWMRLWIFVSAIYFILVTSFVVLNFPKTPILQENYKVKKVTYRGEKGFYEESTSIFTPLSTMKKITYDGKKGFYDDQIGFVPVDSSYLLKAGLEKGPWEDYQKKTTEKRLYLVSYAFLFWLLPCLAIYVSGQSIYWVYKGFKPNKDAQQKNRGDRE